MDEVSPLAHTRVFEIRNGAASEWMIDPSRYEFGSMRAEDLAGGPPAENAAAVLRVLRGEGKPAATAAVVLNAAAALYVAGKAADFDDGVSIASEALRAGAGLAALER